ncbi:glycosyltransferase family 4 protein [Fodinicurvata halophila]|uniref:Glycosyltransferase family 4 protein n=1 Tax=Fodinicurvata halophila TaxID=1419723 RepID=A0ABV8UI09_9PROT
MKPDALLFIGNLRERGGGLAVGLWTAQALAERYRVTIVSWAPADLAMLDATYGTRLAKLSNLEVIHAPAWLRRLFRLSAGRLVLLKSMLLMRIAQRLVRHREPAVIVSTSNETDLKRPLLQYIHFPWLYWPRPDTDLRWYHHSLLVLAYRKLCRIIGNYDPERVRQNTTLANSHWTASLYRQWYGQEADTLHPPAVIPDGAMDWAARKQAVVCLGRISREKRQLDVIEIVRRLRARGHGLELYICGFSQDRDYLQQIQEKAARVGSWVKLHLDLPRAEMLTIAGECRYGIHAMVDEHFGIVVAEMLQLGVLPFVHESGGAAAIVEDKRLLWDNEETAVERVAACLEGPDHLASLRRHCEQRAQAYSHRHFMDSILTYARQLETETSKFS